MPKIKNSSTAPESTTLKNNPSYTNDISHTNDESVYHNNLTTELCKKEPYNQKTINELANTPKWRFIRALVLGFFWLVWAVMLALTIYFVLSAKDQPTAFTNSGIDVDGRVGKGVY